MNHVYMFMIGIVGLMMKSYFIKSLWLWFIVPQFGVQPLTWGVALGIIFLIDVVFNWKSVYKSQIDEIKNYDDKDKFMIPFINFLAQATNIVFVYIFAWLVHCMM